jgi:hypothetical protein
MGVWAYCYGLSEDKIQLCSVVIVTLLCVLFQVSDPKPPVSVQMGQASETNVSMENRER